MNLFKSGTFTWWQMGILKTSVLCVGLAAGAHWSEAIAPYVIPLLGIGFILGLYLIPAWFKQ